MTNQPDNSRTPGEMAFLDHLEELRWRIMYAVGALAVGMALGFFVVVRFDVIETLIAPIKPYLPAGGLVVMHGAAALTIVMQLAFAIGLALALPVILFQVWLFLSPALHAHERRLVKVVIGVSTILFALGAALAYFFAVPATFALSAKLLRGSLTPMYEASAYFGFLTSMVLTFGLAFEVPLGLVALTWLRILSPAALARTRRYAAVVIFAVAAFITPGDAVNATFILSIPLYLLYEGAIFASWIIDRRRTPRVGVDSASPLAAVGALLGSAALWRQARLSGAMRPVA
jgi:sec-independent protein translocase protein TatC